MSRYRKAISVLTATAVLSMGPCLAETEDDFPEAQPGQAYMDQCGLLPNGCMLLFIMALAAGVGAFFILKDSSGHNSHVAI